MLSVPRPNQQHGGRKFSGLTCSQLEVEIAPIGDNTSVRKNDIYATDVSTYYVACKNWYTGLGIVIVLFHVFSVHVCAWSAVLLGYFQNVLV